MKDLIELILPETLRYTKDHEWSRLEGDKVRIGISDYAQDSLGDITFLELPEVGDTFEKGEEFGVVESTKAASELYMPISGEISDVNMDLNESPALVNEDPYGAGWIVEVKPEDSSDVDTLLTRDAYITFLEGLD